MKTTKKVLGVVMALLMLVNVFAMFSYALAPESAIDLTLTVDKDSYNPGDVVTVTVWEQVDPIVGEMRIGGRYAIGYNSAVIAPLSTEKLLPAQNHGVVYFQEGYDDANSTINNTEDSTGMGVAIDDGKGWDSLVTYGINDDGMTAIGCPSDAPIKLFSFQMKLTDSCPNGDHTIGFNEDSFAKYDGYVNDNTMGGVYGTYDDYSYGTAANYSLGQVTIHVGTAAETTIVKPYKEQIRFGKNADGTYAGKFDYRYLAQITTEDFNATFENETKALDMIQEIGFVFASQKKVTTFDVNAAKALVENGTETVGYEKKPVSYISNKDGNYVFSCIVTDIADADRTTGAHAYAYVKYTAADGTTAYAYYDTVTSSTFEGLYNDFKAQAFPGA